MLLTGLLALALLPPRQAETFSGVKMFRSDTMLPQAVIVVPPVDVKSFSVTCSDPGKYVDGYVFTVWTEQFTNTFITPEPFVAFKVTNLVSRLFVTLTVTNAWGDDKCPKDAFFPLYDPDRMDLFVPGIQSFTLLASGDLKKWTSSTVTNKVTVMNGGGQRYFRVQGLTNKLECVAYNPLNF